ncbi:hypothetical protein [Acetobacter oryzifermentans]|uniref:hypothetical protein n=1 Tax=Acetobacter oryzifermentans TaxID=1633874 RepID=UPI000A945D40|nr:hypothetical protein [Acetobacter oryzifermentans]
MLSVFGLDTMMFGAGGNPDFLDSVKIHEGNSEPNQMGWTASLRHQCAMMEVH